MSTCLNPGRAKSSSGVRARSLNFRDLLILQQRYAFAARPGVVPLSDGAGEVVALGSGVTSLCVGDRVAACYFPKWQAGRLEMPMALEQFGCTRDGMLAEHMIADASALVSTPEHLSFEQACTLPCAAVTAWNALVGGRPIAPGETVLTLGTGGVALFALQFAKLLGARVVALTSGMQKAERLRSLGADEVVESPGACAVVVGSAPPDRWGRRRPCGRDGCHRQLAAIAGGLRGQCRSRLGGRLGDRARWTPQRFAAW